MESENNNAMTSPHRVKPVYTPEPVVAPPKPPRKRSISKTALKTVGVILGSLILLLVFAVAGGYLGFLSGKQSRLEAEVGVMAFRLAEQYQMGIDDMNAGRLKIAQERYEWILTREPDFPGLADQLVRLTVEAVSRDQTITPTLTPTPTEIAFTPTPDLRGAGELFSAAQGHMQNREWQDAIQTLINLRNVRLDYEALQADGFFYIALRYRGIQRINNGDLEGGMYDLTLAENFGPLDGDAAGLRSFARVYLTGASFWEADWEKVIFYFGQIYKIVPNLRDTTNITAAERYRLGMVHWGDALMAANDPCKAQAKYEEALRLNNLSTVADKANQAAQACVASYTPTPGPATETPTPTSEIPTETPTPTP